MEFRGFSAILEGRTGSVASHRSCFHAHFNFDPMQRAFPLLFLLLSISLASQATVIHSSDNGFLLRHEIELEAPTWQAYNLFVNDISRWWNGAHSFSNQASNLRLEAKPGGCLCESWSGNKWVEHLRVVQVQPHQVLVLRGALGPLQGLAVSGSMTISFATTDTGKTRITWTYAVGGYAPDGLKDWAAPVDGVIGEQAKRFASFVKQQSGEDNK
jgi:uncharacterized protein YndB with AHSA1/START domain